MQLIPIVCSLLVLFLSGCTHVMSPGNLKQVDTSVRYEALRANPDAFVGKTVMLGGIIAGVRSSGDVSTIEVAQLELFDNGVPDENSRSSGRFLAMSSDLIDPVIYRPGLLLTVIGEVKGSKVQKLDSADYVYPLVAVREMRQFRASDTLPTSSNPYQSQIGDSKFLRRPAGAAGGDPAWYDPAH